MKAKPTGIGPKHLGPHGKKLWAHIEQNCDLEGAEPLLLQLCEIRDRLVQVQDQIRISGIVLDDGKRNPLLITESTLQGEFTRTWRALGLADEPVPERKPVGRPPESDRRPKGLERV